MKNRSLHHGITCSSYDAMFDTRTNIVMKFTSLPESIIHKLKSDDDLKTTLNSIKTTHKINAEKQNEKKIDTSSILTFILSILTKNQLILHNRDKNR